MRRKIRIILYKINRVLSTPYHYFKKNKVAFSARLNGGILNKSRVGKYTYIGPNTVISKATIGNYTSIAPGVQIGGMEHPMQWYATSTAISNKGNSYKDTIIGNNVWVAANAIIRQGITIGDGCVVGAGAFVNKDLPENVVAVGIPAKIIRKRLDDEMLEKISAPGFWEQEPKEIKHLLEEK